ncbi:DEAD/DEAH box helicase [Neobacillus sp. PS3-34]|uniref:DEAD/DEAH box helicase n=1 Tax=Neobacillus sp. PS3-34 TaxID=3070678 RepID=UPI0027E16AE8|nr:DEAD/DEAH box helicase [Neobacillus sp. PS3-34]WML48486.1 DEAD/DEAH box helicase [Neobacillus sp. PS3-34]
MDDVMGIFNNMRDTFLRYMNSPFALGEERLAAERNDLLKKEGIIYQYPYIEVLPPYQSSGKTVLEASQDVNISSDFSSFSSIGLFGANQNLYTHQYQSIKSTIKDKKNVVITSGTGSGKTESFLLPVIGSILQESKKWPSPQIQKEPLGHNGQSWESKRKLETRDAAIRGLILYPLNALVEDQLVRLRQALDSDQSREWFRQNRNGNKIYFGRYTGKSPVSGEISTQKMSELKKIIGELSEKEKDVRSYYHDLTNSLGKNLDSKMIEIISSELKEYETTLQESKELNTDLINEIKSKLLIKLHEKLSYLSKTSGAEMISRWDMQDAPPDIFITNFSMLNIVLTRQIEQNIFTKTREWLEKDTNNTFYLVLDELHAHRGTAGTEVSYIIKTLLNRIGLKPDSPQLRVIATSASIDNDGKVFLEDFFGISSDKFEIITGQRESSEKYKNNFKFKNKVNLFSQFYKADLSDEEKSIKYFLESVNSFKSEKNLSQQVFEVLDELGVYKALIDFCEKPRSVKDIANALFEENNIEAIAGLLKLITYSRDCGQVVVPLRSHLFFRNFQGLWACSNPSCEAIEPQYQFEGRTVGKLYSQPRIQCDCGSKVLDFYYCQNCGDSFLGGYKYLDQTDFNGYSYILSPDFPDLDSLPDKLPATKMFKDYEVFWPGKEVDLEARKWSGTHKGLSVNFAWERAYYNHSGGKINSESLGNSNGFRYVIRPENCDQDYVDNISAFSVRCPHCGDNWEGNKKFSHHSNKRMNSPIRGQRTGFDMIMQVMMDSIMRELSTDGTPKTVLFSDSRQDAAKLSAKLELNHYREILRYIVVNSFKEVNQELRAFISKCRGLSLNPLDDNFAKNFENEHPQDAFMIRMFLENSHLPEPLKIEIQSKVDKAYFPPKLGELWDSFEYALLRLGINPGGPKRSIQLNHDEKWTSLYDWSQNKPIVKELNNDQIIYRKTIIKELKDNVIVNVLFAQRKRDLESLGLAHMTTDVSYENESMGIDKVFWRELINSSLRILGGLKYYYGNEYRAEKENTPPQLKKFWMSVAKHNNLDEERFIEAAHKTMSQLTGLQKYLIKPDEIYIIPHLQGEKVFSCVKCKRIHLHNSCGTCTDCGSKVEESNLETIEDDYYRYSALDSRSARRFHCEEMTGQTDADESLNRQLAFQGIFDKTSLPLVDEIDILSVTTTMEAGVDIGSLKMVSMSNMPPQRFNYQQRVGRCGRRGSSLSISLTLCRGRSHDDWYFDNLDKMTGDAPPQPYIDLKSLKIFKRVLIKESLFYAFSRTGLLDKIKPGFSVHGQYGYTEDWENIKEQIRRFLGSSKNIDFTEDLINVLTYRTKINEQDKILCKEYITSGKVVDDITDIANDSRYTDRNLSTNLATAGLLPMFGFPTRVRYLHHQERKQTHNARTLQKGVIDRDIELAISEYSPGSEVVKDKLKHRIVGLSHYKVRGNTIEADNNPMGIIKKVVLCRKCHFLFDKEENFVDSCPSCGDKRDELNSEFVTLPISEPKGFRTDWFPQDFNEQFEWTSGSSFPKLAQDASNDKEEKIAYNTKFYGQEGNIYSINDNFGSGFNFYKSRNPFHGWIEESFKDEPHFESLLTTEVRNIALGSIKNTDVLVLSPNKIKNGINMNPGNLSVRAALISFGYLFRRVATNLLDVDGNEMQVGVRAYKDMELNRIVGQIFFADQLINGAGYAKHLAQEYMIKSILKDITENMSYLPKLINHNCDSSCYECLRTYENRGYHALLDWRLAIEIAAIYKDENFIPRIDQKWLPQVEKSLSNLEKDYYLEGVKQQWYAGIPAISLPIIRKIIIFGHPLWNKDPDFLNEMLSEARAEAEYESPGFQIIHFDLFDLIRRPMWVMKKIHDTTTIEI